MKFWFIMSAMTIMWSVIYFLPLIALMIVFAMILPHTPLNGILFQCFGAIAFGVVGLRWTTTIHKMKDMMQ